MALNFEPRGAELNIEGTLFQWKRVSSSDLSIWHIKNNPFRKRPPEEQQAVIDKLIAGELKQSDYTEEERELSLKQMPQFCFDFIEDITNFTGLEFAEMPDDQKLLLFEELYQENEEFAQFALAFKSGSKKKFTKVD